MSKDRNVPLGIGLLGGNAKVYNTIAEMQKDSKLKAGKVVEVLGYYQAGDGAGHKRVIADSDDGSGVLLENGLYANIVHNGEVCVSWFGAKGDDSSEDIKPIFDKIIQCTSIVVVHFPQKRYKTSPIHIQRNLSIIGTGNAKAHSSTKHPRTIIEPFTSQEYLIRYGVEEYEKVRGSQIKNICFNSKTSDGGNIEKWVLKLDVFTFSEVDNITIEGRPSNSCIGISWCGYECNFSNISFANFSDQNYVDDNICFELLGRTSPFYSVPSGSTIRDIYLEGGFVTLFKSTTGCVDMIIDRISIENSIGDIEYTPDYSEYKSVPIFELFNTQSLIINNITTQYQGKTAIINGEKYSMNCIIEFGATYGDTMEVLVDGVTCQRVLGDIYTYKNNLINKKEENDIVEGNIEFKNLKMTPYSKKDNFIFINKTFTSTPYRDDYEEFGDTNKRKRRITDVYSLNYNYKNNIHLDRVHEVGKFSKNFTHINKLTPEFLAKLYKVEEIYRAKVGLYIKEKKTLNFNILSKTLGWGNSKFIVGLEFEDGSTQESEIITLIKNSNFQNSNVKIDVEGKTITEFFVKVSNVNDTDLVKDSLAIYEIDIKVEEYIDPANELNTPVMQYAMEQEGGTVKEDYLEYSLEKFKYDKQLQKEQQAKYEAYELLLQDNPNLTWEEFEQQYGNNVMMNLNLVEKLEEPQIPESVKKFMEKYLGTTPTPKVETKPRTFSFDEVDKLNDTLKNL